MYHTIVNPHTNRKVRTNGRIGQMILQNYLMSEQIGGGRKKQKRAELSDKMAKEKCDKHDWKNGGETKEDRKNKWGSFVFYSSINQAFACGEIEGNEFSLGEMPIGSIIKMTAGDQKGTGFYKIKSYNNSTGMMECQLMAEVIEQPATTKQEKAKLAWNRHTNGAIVHIDASDNAKWYGRKLPSPWFANI